MILIANNNGDWWEHIDTGEEWGPLHYIDTDKLTEEQWAVIHEWVGEEVTLNDLLAMDKLEQLLWKFGRSADIYFHRYGPDPFK